MSRIFLSHSSANNAEAVALSDWLQREGWNDVFLDVDPDRGIAAGERWERALNEAAHRCEAVLFLISRAWLASGWCLKEFNLAHRLNKRLFGLLIEDIPVFDLPVNLTGTWQLIRFHAGRDHVMLRVTIPISGQEAHVTFSADALARLRTGLQRAGLDARFFAWPPESDLSRPPYRGLRPLESDDAGIFFGRDAAIVEGLDRLRGLREAAPPRLFVILGASGAGKSSFLRAGILPRLQRDDRNFLTLPVLRPERAAINDETGLVRVLEAATKAHGIAHTRAEIRMAIERGAQGLRPILTSLVAKAHPSSSASDEPRPKPPTLILPIDQSEELFLAEGKCEAEQLLALLRDLLTAGTPDFLALFTMRSDSYERLQTTNALEGVSQQTMSLPPMAKGAYHTVIEGPAERLKDGPRALKIEPALTHALLADIEEGQSRDALPLLAFTLERLYLEYGGRGRLRLADFDALGRIKGSIEAAVERALLAAESDPQAPRDRTACIARLRCGLIPWLAGIDPETGSARRRVARMSEIPGESLPVIKQLVEQRLLTTDVAQDTGEVTIEPAHEALLRQWELLKGWLSDDSRELMMLEGVKRAARDWTTNKRDAAWLIHSGGRLEDAERLRARDDFARHIEPVERDYLAACRLRDDSERGAAERRLERERRNLRRVRWALTAFFVGVMGALGGALWQSYQTAAREAAVFASVAASAAQQGYCDRALRLAVSGLPPSVGAMPVTYRSRELEDSLSRYASAHQCRFKLALSGHTAGLTSAGFSLDGSRIVTTSEDNTARVWDARTGATLATIAGEGMMSASVSPDGSRIITTSQVDWRSNSEVRLWDTRSGATLATLVGHHATFSPDGSRFVTTPYDATARLWDASTGAALAVLSGHKSTVLSAAFSPDGNQIVTTAFEDATPRLWDGNTGSALAVLSGHKSTVLSAAFSPDGRHVVTASEDHTAALWAADSGALTAMLSGHESGVTSATFSPDSSRIVTTSKDRTARIWGVRGGEALKILSGHQSEVRMATFSPDGSRLATVSKDQIMLWDASTGAALSTWLNYYAGAKSVAFSPDSSLGVSVPNDFTARLWDARTGAELAILTGHTLAVASASFSSDGSRVVTSSADHTARLWDARIGAGRATLTGRNVAFSPKGNRIITTGNEDDTTRLWDTSTGAELAVLSGHKSAKVSAAFSRDGRRIVTTADEDVSARLWDGTTGAKLAVLSGHKSAGVRAAFSPNGSRIVTTAFDDDVARLWDGSTGAMLAVLSGHKSPGMTAAFSPDGSRIITTAFEDDTARLWDARTGSGLTVLSGHKSGITSATFSGDGSHVVTASQDHTAALWDAHSGEPLAILSGHESNVTSAIFGPDGNRIVTISSDTTRLWDARNGAALATLSFNQSKSTSAAFSPDGSRIVTSGSQYDEAQLFDARTGAALARFETASSAVFSPDSSRVVIMFSRNEQDDTAQLLDARTGATVSFMSGDDASFSPDSRRLVMRAWRDTAKLWDANDGAELATLSQHEAPVIGVNFSPDGRHVVTSAEAITHVWKLDPIVLMEPGKRQDYICRERLSGAQSFSTQEMLDQILRGREDLRNPCDRVGPLSPTYYWRAARAMWMAFRSFFGR